MNVNRRSFLVGAGAIAAAPLVTFSAPAMATTSHLFPMNTKHGCLLVSGELSTVFLDGRYRQVAFRIQRLRTLPSFHVSSIEDAEIRFIGGCDVWPRAVDLADDRSFIALNRAANRIAVTTRRGRGNHILVHNEEQAAMIAKNESIHHAKAVIANPGVLPSNEIFMFYKASENDMDAGASMAGDRLYMNSKPFGIRIKTA